MTTIKDFAINAGVTVGRCDKEWGGTWSYSCLDSPDCSFCGFRSEQAAYKGWLKDSFGEHTSKAILKLLKELADANTEIENLNKATSDRLDKEMLWQSW